MATIRSDEVNPALRAIGAIKAYRHPRSKCGLRQDVTIRLIPLVRRLREFAEGIDEAEREVFESHATQEDGEAPKIKKGSPQLTPYMDAMREIARAPVEIEDRLCVRLSDLVVRDEDGELEPIEIGEIADLGALLIVEEPEANGKRKKKADK